MIPHTDLPYCSGQAHSSAHKIDLPHAKPHPAACEVIGVPDDVDVSVVISTYNRDDVLGRALASLLQQEPPGPRYEVVLVDNNSTDSTQAVVESFIARGCPNLTYLFEPRQSRLWRKPRAPRLQGSHRWSHRTSDPAAPGESGVRLTARSRWLRAGRTPLDD